MTALTTQVKTITTTTKTFIAIGLPYGGAVMITLSAVWSVFKPSLVSVTIVKHYLESRWRFGCLLDSR